MKTKKIMREFLLLVSISLTILLVVFIIKNKGKFQKSLQTVKLTKTGIDISIQNLHLVEEKDGEKQWVLDADKAEVINSKEITRLTNVRMSFFQKSGSYLSVSADSGIIQNDTKDVKLKGNIKILNQEGYMLQTDNLKWISEQRLIQTDDKVEIRGTDLVITGQGMRVNFETEVVEINKGVRVLYYGKNEDFDKSLW